MGRNKNAVAMGLPESTDILDSGGKFCIYSQKKQTLLSQLSAIVPQSWSSKIQTPTGMRGWFTLLIWLPTINLFQFPCLSTHSWTLTRKSHSKNRGPGESQGEEALRDIPKGASHAAHSSWEKLRGGCSGRCSSRKFITAAGAGLRVRTQESQLARKKLGGWKRELFFSGLYDIKNRSRGICWSAVPSACYYQQAAHLMLWIYYGGFLVFFSIFFFPLDNFWSHLFILVISISCLNLLMTGCSYVSVAFR